MKNLIKDYESKIDDELQDAGIKTGKISFSSGKLLKRVAHEASHKKIFAKKRFYIPDFYQIKINTFDYEVMEFYLEKLSLHLESFLDEFAEDNNFASNISPKVSFFADKDLQTGEFYIKMEFGKDKEEKLDDTQSLSLKDAKKEGLHYSKASITILDEYEKHFLSKESTLIGRLEANDIVVSDASVSRVHAEIVLKNDTYHLKDMESTNGTLLNGKKITEKKLKDGDIITLGNKKLKFEYRK